MKSQVRLVEKPWGAEIIYAVTSKYAGKIITIRKGHRLSLQYHKAKHETVYVLKGKLSLRIGERNTVVRPGQAFAIAPRTIHRFSAPHGPVTLLEVSTPELLDVVRLSDDYGRK